MLIRRIIWYKNSFEYFIGYNDVDVIRPEYKASSNDWLC